MINIIEGKEYKEYIKLICKVMKIEEDKHNLEFYINKNVLRDCLDYRKDTVKIYINERDNIVIQSSIIYLLQKYRFLCCTLNRGYSPELLELMDCYLSNYYSMTLALDLVGLVNKSDNEIKCKYLDEAIKDTVDICKRVIDNCEKDTGLGFNKLIGKILACRNILKKYNDNDELNIIEEAEDLANKLRKLEWYNIHEKYNEILKSYNNLIKELQ